MIAALVILATWQTAVLLIVLAFGNAGVVTVAVRRPAVRKPPEVTS